eukprot:485211-Rhodomonas_salina.1
MTSEHSLLHRSVHVVASQRAEAGARAARHCGSLGPRRDQARQSHVTVLQTHVISPVRSAPHVISTVRVRVGSQDEREVARRMEKSEEGERERECEST